MFRRLTALLVCVAFIFSNFQYVHAQDFSINQLPVPGKMVGVSTPFVPVALKGIVIDPQKPLQFQFIVDTGSDKDLSFPNASVGNPVKSAAYVTKASLKVMLDTDRLAVGADLVSARQRADIKSAPTDQLSKNILIC